MKNIPKYTFASFWKQKHIFFGTHRNTSLSTDFMTDRCIANPAIFSCFASLFRFEASHFFQKQLDSEIYSDPGQL